MIKRTGVFCLCKILQLKRHILYTNDVFTVGTKAINGGRVLPGLKNELYLLPVEKKDIDRITRYNERNGNVILFVPSSENGRFNFQNIDEEQEYVFYYWDRFINKVCREKLCFLYDHFSFDDTLQKERVYIGENELHQFMKLLTGYNNGGYINLARFAYALAQWEPKHRLDCLECYTQIRRALYFWYKNKEDRQELAAAVQLVISGLK